MSDYAKIQVTGLYSEASDYSEPIAHTRSGPYSATPSYHRHDVIRAQVAGTTVELGTFDTPVTGCAIYNKDATNFVEVRWTSQSTANKQKLLAGSWFVCSDVTVSADIALVADTADVDCEVFL